MYEYVMSLYELLLSWLSSKAPVFR